ncbi:hypothetical protein E5D57_003761 [Metarhizium anisopliae]|nr:hypothetical protein E5D57_003761 [Metarhizium anisopliae]
MSELVAHGLEGAQKTRIPTFEIDVLGARGRTAPAEALTRTCHLDIDAWRERSQGRGTQRVAQQAQHRNRAPRAAPDAAMSQGDG